MLDEILSAIAGLTPSRIQRVDWESGGGPGNQHWRIWTKDGERYVLRRHAGFQTRPQIDYEAAVLAHLASSDFPVPERIGNSVADDQGRLHSLYTYMPGKRLPDGPTRQRERGQVLARIHAANRPLVRKGQRPGYDCLHDPRGIKTRVGWPGKLRSLRLHHPGLAQHIAAADAAVTDSLRDLHLEMLPTTVIHCDFQAHNIHYQRARISGILDFDLTHLDLRAADLAIAGTPEFIAGYREAADPPLTSAETAAIDTLQKVLHLHQVAFLLERNCLDPGAYQPHLHCMSYRNSPAPNRI